MKDNDCTSKFHSSAAKQSQSRRRSNTWLDQFARILTFDSSPNLHEPCKRSSQRKTAYLNTCNQTQCTQRHARIVETLTWAWRNDKQSPVCVNVVHRRIRSIDPTTTTTTPSKMSNQSLPDNKHDHRGTQRPGRRHNNNSEDPSLPRSSRIRNRTVAFATPVTNTNDDRQSFHTTTERKKDIDTSSSIAEHEETTGHHMDWRNFRIVWRDNNVYRLLIKESLIIKAHEPRLNRTTHSVPLLVFPEGLKRHLVPDPNG